MEQPSAPASSAASLTSAKAGTSGARTGSTSASLMLRPQQREVRLMQRRHQRGDVPQVGDRLADGEPFLRHQPARLGGQHLGMRMDQDDAQRVGHRQRDQIERIRRPDQDNSAQHARRHVVGVRRSRRRRLSPQRARHQVVRRQHAPEQRVHRHRARHAAGRGTPEPAAKRHLLVQPEPDAARAVQPFERRERRNPDHVLAGIRAQRVGPGYLDDSRSPVERAAPPRRGRPAAPAPGPARRSPAPGSKPSPAQTRAPDRT